MPALASMSQADLDVLAAEQAAQDYGTAPVPAPYDPAQDPQAAYTGQPASTAPVPPPPVASPSAAPPLINEQQSDFIPPSWEVQVSYPASGAPSTRRPMENTGQTYTPTTPAAQDSSVPAPTPEEFLAALARADHERELDGLFGGTRMRDYYDLIRDRSIPKEPRPSNVAPI